MIPSAVLRALGLQPNCIHLLVHWLSICPVLKQERLFVSNLPDSSSVLVS